MKADSGHSENDVDNRHTAWYASAILRNRSGTLQPYIRCLHLTNGQILLMGTCRGIAGAFLFLWVM